MLLLPLFLILPLLAIFIMLPFRAKNPPERFPYVTVTLIAINTLIFLATSHYGLSIRKSCLDEFAVTHNNLSIYRLLTAMFLHATLLHLVGNMLALWVFGASVEGRLKPFNFTALYLLSGLTGGLLSDLTIGMINPDIPSLGASGAIMGLAGAYLYMFPHSIIRVFRIWLVARWFGPADWPAWGVILYYIGFDLLNGLLYRGADGVGHFAHLGGFATGFLAAMVLRAPRDTVDYSSAQAMRADIHDYSLMTLPEVEALMQHPAPSPELVVHYCEKSLGAVGFRGEEKCVWALQQHGRLLIDQGDPVQVAAILLRLPLAARAVSLLFFLRLGSRLERCGANDAAIALYRRISEIDPQSPDAEVALYRLGRLLQQAYQDRDQARAIYGEMLRRFPHGHMALEARGLLDHM